MWILTPTGFYSAVTDNDDDLKVRTRTLDDAERLVERVFTDGEYTRIITRHDTDYRHRVRLTRTQWADFVAAEANGIDYANFKNAIAERQGWDRERLYADVWATLYRLQTREVTEGPGTAS